MSAQAAGNAKNDQAGYFAFLLEKSFRGSLRDGVWRLDGLLTVSRQIGVTREFAVEDEKS